MERTVESLPGNAALVLIDVQEGFRSRDWGAGSNPFAEANIAALLERWRLADMPIFHVRHFSTTPGSPLEEKNAGSRFMEIAAPAAAEPVITKSVNSAFIGTDLERQLRERGIETLVVAGLTTDHCVSTSIRMAANLGFSVYCVGDATATFDRIGPDGKYYRAEDVHAFSLVSLHGEFAVVTDTNSILGAASRYICEKI